MNNSDMSTIIKKWYDILGFSAEYDSEFIKALSEIEISDSIEIKDFKENQNGKLNFLSYLYFCEKVKDKYQEKNIPESILIETLKDLVIWTDIWSGLKGELYLGECEWLKRHLSMKLFKLGRLQFCMGVSDCDIPEVGVLKGDSVMEVHIPETGPLSIEECEKSFDNAKEFFKKYFPEFDYKCFTCHSWLMDNSLKEILSPESNIIKFQNMFTHISDDESYVLLKYIFKWNTTEHTVKDEPAPTSLAKKVKDRVLSGAKFYESLGVIKK